MDLQLGGRVGIVTGGGGGIGRAAAAGLVGEGASVTIAGRSSATLEAARAELAAVAGEDAVVAVPTDTTDDESVRHLVETVIGRHGRIDFLVNAASRPGLDYVRAKGTIDDFDRRSFDLDIDTKVLGYLRCIREVVPHMRAAGHGRIVNVSGLSARRTSSITGTVRNVAVAAMAKNVADEVGRHGINVTVVHPGLTRTGAVLDTFREIAGRDGTTADAVEAAFASTVSTGRLVEPDEVAHVVVFLCSPLSVAINGDAIACGGGDLRAIHY